MNTSQYVAGLGKFGSRIRTMAMNWALNILRGATCLAALTPIGGALAQVSVVTAHNDLARTGQNLNETILTPLNVTAGSFGKLFSQKVSGGIFAQPLYVSQVTIPGKGVHNVVYVGGSTDVIYAFDADNNGGVNANPLWQVNLTTNTSPAGTYTSEHGLIGTPTIDLSSNTMYLVSSETQVSTSNPIYRLHALDITSGAEKFGGPVLIQGSVPGTGTASVGGVLTFDPSVELQRAGLLLLNGVLYLPFGSIGDIGPWHGWLFSYNAKTLSQIDLFCTSPNGSGAGIWMGGAGLAAEVNDPTKPYGRMFVATGNGSYAPSSQSYGMSVLDLDLTGGQMTVEDEFTPFNQALLDGEDGDLGSGGPVLLPVQTLTSGTVLSPLVQIGKSGMIYILDRNNLGGFNAAGDTVFQEVQTPEVGSHNWGAGVWGTEAYWNNTIYSGGIDESINDPVSAYSFAGGVLSSAPASQTDTEYSYPGPTPSISSNGATNGILWVINSALYDVGDEVLLAYNANNLGSPLYSSNENLAADNPGGAIKFAVPTIANGKVFVGALGQLDIYGLLGTVPTVAPPVISPPGATFTGSQSVTITDATPGAIIYYTTTGTTPTVASKIYSGPITVTSNETISAIASATGYLQGAPVSATFSSTANAANPIFKLPPGTYIGSHQVTISDSSSGAVIYYTVDGTTPTTSSNVYTKPVDVLVSETIQAMATAPGLQPSSVASAAYTIIPNYAINFTQGFAEAQALGQMQFNGSTSLDDIRLQLTDGGKNEAGSAFFTTPVNIQSFTTDFTFQLSNAVGDGMTFTIQNEGPTALGGSASDLGYAGINKSLAIKFDFYNDDGQGNDSTGLYINGVAPTLPSIDLTNTGIVLNSGDTMNVHLTYDGTMLTMTITDALTLTSWSTSFTIDIPHRMGGNTAYVGFTGGTGSHSSSQKVTYWTYVAGTPSVPNYPAGFDAATLKSTGSAALNGTVLQLTDGGQNEVASAYYSTPVAINSFVSDFQFKITRGSTATLADGLTFVIQNAGVGEIGSGSGGLGYAGIPDSVAIKFDIYNNAGEGTNSTGVYVNGAMPTVPSINVTTGVVNLGSGSTINCHITYDGTTLTWALSSGAQGTTKTMTINIPNLIGSNTAYVGFTGASGDGTANQRILNWTFTNP